MIVKEKDESLPRVIMHDCDGMDESLPRAGMHDCEGMDGSFLIACHA